MAGTVGDGEPHSVGVTLGDGIHTGTITMVTAITRGDGDMVSTIHGDGILIGITTTAITHTGDTVRDMDIITQTGIIIARIGEVPINRQ